MRALAKRVIDSHIATVELLLHQLEDLKKGDKSLNSLKKKALKQIQAMADVEAALHTKLSKSDVEQLRENAESKLAKTRTRAFAHFRRLG